MSEMRDRVYQRIKDILFMGSGKTLWVAKKLGRRAVGYEWDDLEDYGDMATAILDKIPELAIVDRKAELPTYWMGEEMPYRFRNHLIEDGWVKEIKDSE